MDRAAVAGRPGQPAVLALWSEYPKVMTNSSAGIWYAIGELPYLLLAIAAWLVSTKRGRMPAVRWVAALLGRGGQSRSRP